MPTDTGPSCSELLFLELNVVDHRSFIQKFQQQLFFKWNLLIFGYFLCINFYQCMKKLEVIENRVKSIEKNESDFVCCSYNGECGMMKNAR